MFICKLKTNKLCQLLSFMFYNTENFYDIVDDPLTLDDDFTPKGFREWTAERFNRKVMKLTK